MSDSGSLDKIVEVVLLSEQGIDNQLTRDTCTWFERHAGPVQVRKARSGIKLAKNSNGEIEWQPTFEILANLRLEQELEPSVFQFLITASRNENNWYAVQNPRNPRDVFAHSGDFRWVTPAPASAINAHYILKTVFNTFLSDAQIDKRSISHDKPRGCFSDFCADKWDLSFKLRTGDICGDCMEVFQTIPAISRLIPQAVELMEGYRPLALNTLPYLKKEHSFHNWPFPVAITRHKIIQATNSLLRLFLLLDHFDSLVRFFFLGWMTVNDQRIELVEKPSLGWWVDQLAQSVSEDREFKQVVRIAEEERIVMLRNERRAHGWLQTEVEAYREEADALENAIGRIEESMESLFRQYRLVTVEHLRLEQGRWVVEGKQLMGSHALHPPFLAELNAEPQACGISDNNHVYLAAIDSSQFWSLHPFLRETVCPECRHKRLLVSDGGDRYLDVEMGHRVTLDA